MFDHRPLAGSFGADGQGRAVLSVGYWTGSRWSSFALRYLPDGTPDASYGRGGMVEVGESLATRSLVRRDGSVYTLARVNRGGGARVFALDADGRRVAGFRSRTLSVGRFKRLEEPQRIVAGPGGGLLVFGGYFDRSGWVARLYADGRPDRRFGDRGLRMLPRFTPHALVRDRRGRLVLAGLRQGGVYGQAGVIRLSAKGNPDRSFGLVAKQLGALRGVRLVASEAHHVALDDRDRIVIAGETYDDDYAIRDDLGRSYPAIARLRG